MSKYYLQDGTSASYDEIKAAFGAGNARLVHSRGEGKTITSLRLDGQDFDTRGECHSVWDEAWTQTPKTLQQCLAAVGAYRD